MAAPFERLGPALRLLRERRGMTQAQLQERAGLGPGMVSEWEREQSAPHIRNLRALLEALDASLYDLAEVLDAATGARPEIRRPGRVEERWKQELVEGGIDRRAIEMLAIGAQAGENPDTAAAVIATASAAAEEIARSVIGRQQTRIGELVTAKAAKENHAIGSLIAEPSEAYGARSNAKRPGRRR